MTPRVFLFSKTQTVTFKGTIYYGYSLIIRLQSAVKPKSINLYRKKGDSLKKKLESATGLYNTELSINSFKSYYIVRNVYEARRTKDKRETL